MQLQILRVLVFVCAAALSLSFGAGGGHVGLFSTAIADDDDDGGGGGRRGFGGGGGGFLKPNLLGPKIISRALGFNCRCLGLPIAMCPCSRRARRVSRRAPAAAPPPRSKRKEIIATGLTSADIAQLTNEGYSVVRESEVGLIATRLYRIKPPSNRGIDSALKRAAELIPAGSFAQNDLYPRTRTVFRTAGRGCGRQCKAFDLTAWSPSIGDCRRDIMLGIIDTGVDVSHPSLLNTNVVTNTLRSADHVPSSRDHGTAVVSLLVGKEASEIAGVIPGAKILAADAFHKGKSGDEADAFDLILALDWLAGEGVKVINLSLSGPDNAILANATQAALDKGITIVAAAGLPDNSRTTGYPGRYPGVVAVSAIDERLRPSRLSARGDHISFTAPGVGLMVAAPNGGIRLVDGTSFAAPFVAAAYAIGRGQNMDHLVLAASLTRSAKDLGAVGRDPIYGWGLLQYSALPACSL